MNDQIRALIAQHEQKGDFTHVAPTKEMLASAQRLLGLTIPQQFVDFLHEYSYGGIGGITILGVGLDGSMAFLEETLSYRKYGLPHNLLVVENCDEWLWCLDCDSGEVVSWSQADGDDILPGYPSFDDFLLDDLQEAIDSL
ncbi:MAG: SMI1/KNR4 family protein [Coriobacteriaceae bacterium]|nr:MAG: SMI1/KNR4 family protein [Coriobacteriaceae bacterium]